MRGRDQLGGAKGQMGGAEGQVGRVKGQVGGAKDQEGGAKLQWGMGSLSPASTRWSMVGKRLQTAVLTERRMSSEVRFT